MGRLSEIAACKDVYDTFYINRGDQSVSIIQSPEIGEITAALAQAQSEIKGAVKGADNPFFKSKYADLATCWESVRAPLTKNNLAVIQSPVPGKDNHVTIVTTIAHTSGQWFRSTLEVPLVKSDPQAVGSAITYARRYALAAMTALAQTDDDGEAAMARSKPKKKAVSKALKNEAEAAAERGIEGFRKWYKALSEAKRVAIAADPKYLESLADKARAAAA